MTIKDDQNDDVFSDAQQKALNNAFQKMNTQLGLDSYDVKKQEKILKGRLEQIPRPQPKHSKSYKMFSRLKNGFSGPWFTAAIASFGIGLVMSRLFFIAEPLQVANINFTSGPERIVQSASSNNASKEVMEAAQSVLDKTAIQPLEMNIQALDLVNERNKLIEAALKAGLTIQISEGINGVAIRVDGLRANLPKQKEFKALFKVPQEQQGPIIFTLIKQ